MGDIGLLATKIRGAEAYHVFVGGGFGANQAVGRQVFSGLGFEELKTTLEKMLKGYLRHREPGQTFGQFTQRLDVGTLQAIFSNDE
jgi:ferredoxin-nitrite reductase